ncbi:TonB-dependent receptor [Bacteroidia bacterium]|nr:TonB-dependent receptor [Bacteroidia bacterium]
MMIRCIFTILLCTTGSATLYGQSAAITGVVADSVDKASIAGVIIQLFDAKGKALSYTFSKDDGKFSLPYSGKGSVLSFKSMGYRKCTVPISGNQSPLEILLAEEAVQLRDVIIKAPDILMKSDTLVYNVRKYADAGDRTIADVLKKMPGIEVAESGQIKYNGLPINKFYIEGNDLLEGRYGLASNNISHNDVQNVEIMENHQPIQALQGIDYSEQAGLNLRLKESAKLRWTGIVNGGTGFSPLLYDASLFAMRIAGKRQCMETARINNTGWNPASQSARHTTDNLFGTTTLMQNQLPDYITVGEYATPTEERRIRFNQSCLFNTTNSITLKNDYDIKANITYESDNLDFTRSSYTGYFDNSLSPLTETEYLRTRAHTFSGQFALQSNKPSMYLKDYLSVDYGWNNAMSDIAGSYEIKQKAEKPVFNLANELQAVKHIKNRILTLSSSNKLVKKPHSLLMENQEKQYFQDVTALAFQSITETSYGWIFGRWQVKGRAGFNYNYNELESNLTGINIGKIPVTNHSNLSVINMYIRPEIVYENKRLWLNPYIIINYYRYSFNEKISGEHLTKNDGIISPALSIRYKFTAGLELFTDARYVTTPPEKDIFYWGAIMNNYRYLNAGYPSYNVNTVSSVALSLRYRNPISSVFANIGFKYEKNNYSLTEEQLFVNEQILTTYSPVSNNSDTYRFNGGISKGIFSGKIHIGMDMGCAQIKTATIRNSVVVPYQSNSIFAMPKIKGTILKWISAEYTLLASKNRMNFKDNGFGSSYINLKQKLTVSLFPIKKIQAHIGVEHYHTKFNDQTAENLLLPDAGVRWRLSDKVDISLSASNLMNEGYYRYSRHETLSETTYCYRLRPRNIILSAQVKF